MLQPFCWNCQKELIDDINRGLCKFCVKKVAAGIQIVESVHSPSLWSKIKQILGLN